LCTTQPGSTPGGARPTPNLLGELKQALLMGESIVSTSKPIEVKKKAWVPSDLPTTTGGLPKTATGEDCSDPSNRYLRKNNETLRLSRSKKGAREGLVPAKKKKMTASPTRFTELYCRLLPGLPPLEKKNGGRFTERQTKKKDAAQVPEEASFFKGGRRA